jgi:hypothetical protein
MSYDPIVVRVAARFQKQADQPPGARQDAAKALKPINRPKGISHETIKNYVRTEDDYNRETIDPKRTDIQPKDVFQPKPRNLNVLDYIKKGWPGTSADYTDMQHAIKHEIPHDKGHATVRNLSQYLVRTEGGGDTPALGTKTEVDTLK